MGRLTEMEYDQIYTYVVDHSGVYPSDFTKNQKRVLRRKCQEHFNVDNGVLYYCVDGSSNRIVIRTEKERERIVKSCHSSNQGGGHFGRDKTYQKVAERFYWPEVALDVQKFIKMCDVCQRINSTKFSKVAAPLHPIKVEPQVWKMVGIDLIGPLPKTPRGNRHIVTLVDYFSKWPEAEALPDKSARSVSQFLFKTMCRFGCVKVIISDQGREFVNNVNKELFRLTGTDHRVSSAFA